MALRGENIGTAYVRILADGTGFDAQVKRIVKDSEPAVTQGAKKNADIYDAAFNKQLRRQFKGSFGKTKKEMFQELNESLTDSLVRLELSDRFFNGPEWKKFQKRLERAGGPAGKVFADRFARSLRDSGALENVASGLTRLGPELRHAQRDLIAEMQTEALALNKKFDKDRLAAEAKALADQAALQTEALHMNQRFDRQRLDAERRYLAEAFRLNKEFDRRRAMLNEAHRLNREFDLRRQRQLLDEAFRMNAQFNRKIIRLRQQEILLVRKVRGEYGDLRHVIDALSRGEVRGAQSRRVYIRQLEELARQMRATGQATDAFNVDLERQRRTLIRSHPVIGRFNRNIDVFSDTFGRAFGRGSRNNFLNFFGSLMRNMVRLIKVVPSAIGFVSRLGAEFASAFSQVRVAGGGILNFIKALGAGGFSVFATLGKTVAGLAVALGVLVVALGPVIALMSLLLGIITALASTVVFAAIAAVSALAGALVLGLGSAAGTAAALLLPVIAAIGGIVVAFQSLNDAQREALKLKFKPLTDELKELGDVVRQGVFSQVEQQVRNLTPVLEGLRPLAAGVAGAIANAFTSFTESLNDRPFRLFRDAMETFLPGAIESLSRSIANALGGIGGLFRGMIPFMDRTLQGLENITGKFENWANSARGQTAIKGFFTDVESLGRSVANIIEGLAGSFGAMSTPGGLLDQFLAGLERVTQKFADFANPKERPFGPLGTKAIKSQTSPLEKFFADATESAKTLIGFLDSIVDLLGTIFGGTRETGDNIFEKMTKSVEKFNTFLKENPDALKKWADDSERLYDNLSKVLAALAKIIDLLDTPLTRNITIGLFGGLAAGLLFLSPGLLQATVLIGSLAAAIDKINWENLSPGAVAETIRTGINRALETIGRNIREFFTTTLPRSLSQLPSFAPMVAGAIVGGLAGALVRALGEIGIGRLITRVIESDPVSITIDLVGDALPGLRTILSRIGTILSLTPIGIVASLTGSGLPNLATILSRMRSILAMTPIGIIAGLTGSALPNLATIITRMTWIIARKLIPITINVLGSALSAVGVIQDAVAWIIDNSIIGIQINVGGNALSMLDSIISKIGQVASSGGGLGFLGGFDNPFSAMGGMFNGAQWRIIGEAGPEAVVPLNRPLSQVDPAVRWLSAIAQGKGMAAGGVVGGGRTFNVEQHIYSPMTDPRATATEVVNRLVAVGY